MGTIEENRHAWGLKHRWDQQGDEFSVGWGSTNMVWWGTIMPRIHAFVPAASILEIAPGFGRCTQFLKDICQRLTVVDLNEKCISACRRRFASSENITYHVNDGTSLAMVPDKSVDFVFSYDSLVHVEADAIFAYLEQLASKLKPDGIGFFHHSNLGMYARSRGKLPFYLNNKLGTSGFRAASMSYERFEEYCLEAGLQCVSQEPVVFYPDNSIRGAPSFYYSRRARGHIGRVSRWAIDRFTSVLSDCFSVFTVKDSIWARPNRVFVNRGFWSDVRKLSRLSTLYGFTVASSAAGDRAALQGPPTDPAASPGQSVADESKE